MISQSYQLYVERIDAARNMARFYALSIEPTLFGEACLVRRWGRIGSRGRTVIEHYGQEKEAVVAFLDLLRVPHADWYRAGEGFAVGCRWYHGPPASGRARPLAPLIAEAFNLVTAAIILFNRGNLGRALGELRRQGRPIDPCHAGTTLTTWRGPHQPQRRPRLVRSP